MCQPLSHNTRNERESEVQQSPPQKMKAAIYTKKGELIKRVSCHSVVGPDPDQPGVTTIWLDHKVVAVVPANCLVIVEDRPEGIINH